MYLSNGQDLVTDKGAATAGNASYKDDESAQQADSDSEEITFSFTFTEKTRLIGACISILWISCHNHNDFNVFVLFRKADLDSKVLRNINIPLKELGVSSANEVEDTNVLKYLGPTGILRASYRALDPVLSKQFWLPQIIGRWTWCLRERLWS